MTYAEKFPHAFFMRTYAAYVILCVCTCLIIIRVSACTVWVDNLFIYTHTHTGKHALIKCVLDSYACIVGVHAYMYMYIRPLVF